MSAGRCEGVFLPTSNAPSLPIYFAEIQFQPDPKFYSRFFAEIFLYLDQTELTNDWHGVVIYPTRNIDTGRTEGYIELLTTQRVTRVYLDESGSNLELSSRYKKETQLRTEDWLAQGNLGEALTQARRDVTSNPQGFGLRFLLFELLVLMEEFDQAEDELRYAAAANPNISDPVELYLGLLSAERLRYNWMTKAQGSPNGLLKPPDYGAKFAEASSLLCEGRVKEAEVLLSEGWQQVPKLSGSLDGERFSEIRDADDVLGPFLEALVPGQYYWIPFEQIQRVEFQPKDGYQDTIWMPAYIEMKQGVRGNLWFPSLYSGTSKKSDYSKLGQVTEWEYPSPNVARAYGQRDLKFDRTLKGIRQVSTILLDNSR